MTGKRPKGLVDTPEYHPLRDLISKINQTHQGLGALAAVSLIAAKAQKCLINISAPGCGKSTVTDWLMEAAPNAYRKGSMTKSSLKRYEEEMNGFSGQLLFDDLGAIDTEWGRVQTMVSMAELTYGHHMAKDNNDMSLDIDDFHGGVVLNIQPAVLREAMSHPTWHSNLADKSMRYYHLRRAVNPNRAKLDAPIDWGIDLAEVADYSGNSEAWQDIISIGLEQWTRARAMEHCGDLLRAVAALGSKIAPEESDVELLRHLMLPMTVEMECVEQSGFGEKATLDTGLLYLLTEFASYPKVTYAIIAQDMRIRERRVHAILETMVDWFERVGTNPVLLQPTPRLKQVLSRGGYICDS